MIFGIMPLIGICSCSVPHYGCSVPHNSNRYFRIYKRINNGPLDPTFLKLKRNGFELYTPVFEETRVGLWEIRGDTLKLYPSFEYSFIKGKWYIENYDDSISSITSIPKQYIIKRDMLYDITDYSPVLPGITDQFKGEDFRRMK